MATRYVFRFPSDTNTQHFLDYAEHKGIDVTVKDFVVVHVETDDPDILQEAKDLGSMIEQEGES